MQPDWEMQEDEEAFEGPDAYVEGDEIEDRIEDRAQAQAEAEPEPEVTYIDVNTSSVQGILRCEHSRLCLIGNTLMIFISSIRHATNPGCKWPNSN